MLERHRILAKEQFISETALQDKEDQFELLQSQLLSAQRQKFEFLQNIATLGIERDQSAAKTQQEIGELDRQALVLEQETAEAKTKDQYAISSPIDGYVTAITGQVGQVTGTQALATIVPADGNLVAHLYTSSKAIGFVEKGQSVRLRYQAYPYQKFGQQRGTVKEISQSPIPPADVSIPIPASFSSNEGLYRITVELESQEFKSQSKAVRLMPGMLVDANIEQERRRLIEWILDPLIDLKIALIQ